MKLTNKFGLPQPLVEAVANDSYSGDTRPNAISVTTLMKPVRLVTLERQHRDELEVDVVDNIFSLLGQTVHTILERANQSDIVEKRLGHEFNGWYVNGQLDSYTLHAGLLRDWKNVSAWAIAKGSKTDEWTIQLSLLAWLLRKNGMAPVAGEVVAIIRDWSRREASRKLDYPQKQVEVFPITLWDDTAVETWLAARLKEFEAARVELPQCSNADRWRKPPQFAVTKKGRKTAVRLCLSEDDARLWIANNGKPGEVLGIEPRAAEAVRCQFYCPVSQFCSQWRDDPTNTPPPADLIIDIQA